MDNNSSRFTIREDSADVPDSIYTADAENLRIEKLGNRLTLVTMLIPCLMAVVLAVAYLDIKNRVVSTQNSGTIGVQNLAKDLESRFSNLSLKQAKLEEQLNQNTSALQTLSAGLKANLTKSMDDVKGGLKGKANQSDLKALSKETESAIGNLKKQLAEINASFDKFDEELAGQILLISQSVKEDHEALANLEGKALHLENEKLSKESLKLSIGLERLSLQEMVKDNIRKVEKKLSRLDKRIKALDQQVKKQAIQSPQPLSSPVQVHQPTAPKDSTPSAPESTTTIEELPIN